MPSITVYLPQGTHAAITCMPQLVIRAGTFDTQGELSTGKGTRPGACELVLLCGAATAG